MIKWLRFLKRKIKIRCLQSKQAFKRLIAGECKTCNLAFYDRPSFDDLMPKQLDTNCKTVRKGLSTTMLAKMFSTLTALILLLTCCTKTIAKENCVLDPTKGMMTEYKRVVLVKNDGCHQGIIRDSISVTKFKCLQSCFEEEECDSFYFDLKEKYCILYRPAVDTNLMFCMQENHRSDAIHAYLDRKAFREMVRSNLLSRLIISGNTCFRIIFITFWSFMARHIHYGIQYR